MDHALSRRLEAIGLLPFASSESRHILDETARRASVLMGVPVGLVSIVLDDTQWFAGRHGLAGWMASVNGAPQEWSFCKLVVESATPLYVRDAAVDPRFANNPVVVHEGVRSYVGVPLVTGDRQVVGALCAVGSLGDPLPSASLGPLEALARETMTQLETVSRLEHEGVRRVLIVDDSLDDIEWIRSMLPGLEVATADSVEAALAHVAQTPPDAVISDLNLPDGTGSELAQKLVDTCPVVVVTGVDRPPDLSAMLASGAMEYLVKDELTAPQLRRALDSAAVRGRLERQVRVLRAAEREARDAAEAALAKESAWRGRLATLFELTSAVSSASTTKQVTEAAVASIPTYDGFAVSIYFLAEHTLHLQAARGFEDHDLAPWRSIPMSAKTPLTAAVRNGSLVYLGSAAALATEYGVVLDRPWSGMAVPLRMGSEIGGVLGLRVLRDMGISDDTLEFATLAAAVIGQALGRARLLEEARASAEFEERMMAMLGHDLCSSLEVVSLSAELLASGSPPAAIAPRLDRATGNMRALIEDILGRARARRNSEAPIGGALTDLAETVTAQVEELRTANPTRAIELEVEPLSYACDRVRISQVVSNLVRNALNHGAAGAPVRVRLFQNEGVVLEVVNQGSPIPPELRERMFDPFQRGRNSRGTGLGLFIVHEIVSSLGGTVRVDSGTDGTTFRVRLPARS